METMQTKAGDYPITERIAARTIALPFFANLTDNQITRIAETLTEALKQRA